MKIDKIDKGEIVYCNLDITYTRKKKQYFKKLTKFIFARKYKDNEFPNINVVNYARLINKIDKKNSYYIENVKIVNLDILVRTGYIAKFDNK